MPKQNKKFSFRETFGELEKINEWFSRDDIEIDEALEKFKKGMELVRISKKQLAEAENEFKRIKKELEE